MAETLALVLCFLIDELRQQFHALGRLKHDSLTPWAAFLYLPNSIRIPTTKYIANGAFFREERCACETAEFLLCMVLGPFSPKLSNPVSSNSNQTTEERLTCAYEAISTSRGLYFVLYVARYLDLLDHSRSELLEAIYCTILYSTLFYSILYYTILYYTILYYTILYYTILYYTILY